MSSPALLPAAGATSLPSTTVVHAATPAVGALPAALVAPWAQRAGYVGDWATSLQAVQPLTGPVRVTLTLWPSNLGLFDRSPGARALTDAEFARTYSPSNATVEALTQYFTAAGVEVTHVSADRLTVSLLGPATAMGAAFGTTLLSGVENGRAVHVPESPPVLPAALQANLAAVSGLSDGFTQFHLPLGKLPPPPARTAGRVPLQGRTSSFITPNDVHSIYGLDALYNFSGGTHFATGEGIALVLWGDGYDGSDLATFFSNYYSSSFPAPVIKAVPVDGAPAPSPSAVNDPSQAPLELTLDLEWSGSEAPGATLYAVYAPDGPSSQQFSPTDATLEDALSQAINEPGVAVVSMSFATTDGADPTFQAAFATSFQSALARGITPVAASGDNGGTNDPKGACTSTPQPEFPAASPLVVAVGGTAPVLSQSLTGATTGLDSESAWKDSGGGFAVDYSAPSWQLIGSAQGPISASGHRGIPDVAGPAADNFLFFGGQEGAGNGTSFASPTWAGILAEMDALRGQPLGQLDPRLYALAAQEPSHTVADALVDITSGANCLGAAGPGWDTATGWGSPRAGLLYQSLTASFVDVNLSAGAGSVAPGGSLTATVTVRNATSLAPIANVPVNVTLTSPGYSGPCGGTLSSPSGVTNSSGNVSVSVSVPACFLGTHASLTATVLAQGLFGSVSTTISINLLGLAGFLAFLQTFPYNLIAFGLIMVLATVVGWAIGNRRRRRRAAAVLAATPPQPVGAVPSSGGTPGPVRPGAVAVGGTARPASGASAPPAARAPAPGAAPRPAAVPALAAVVCPVCDFHFEPELGFCPRCGHYMPGRGVSDPGAPPG